MTTSADVAGVHVRARLGSERYAFGVEHVLEVLTVDRATAVPGAPASIVGVQDVHGAVVAIVDPSGVLGSRVEGPTGPAILVEAAGIRAALLVDEITGVGVLSGALQERDEGCLHGAVLSDGALIGVVDVPALLDAVRAR